MLYTYKMSKQDSWRAETEIKLGKNSEGNDMVLEITTRKALRGELVTRASVSIHEGFFRSTRIFHDFSKTLYRHTAKRVTEKAVREGHEHVLDTLDDTGLLPEVYEHYKNLNEEIVE